MATAVGGNSQPVNYNLAEQVIKLVQNTIATEYDRRDKEFCLQHDINYVMWRQVKGGHRTLSFNWMSRLLAACGYQVSIVPLEKR